MNFEAIKKTLNKVAKSLLPYHLRHRLFHLLFPFNTMSLSKKIKHKMFFDQRMLLSEFADKVKIKNIIADLIGEEYILPNLAVVSDVNEIEFGNLPREFVIKPSHGSQAGFLISDAYPLLDKPIQQKRKIWGGYYSLNPSELTLNLNQIKTICSAWLDSIYEKDIELAYENIPRRIIIEELLHFDESSEFSDFRMYVFHGKVKFFRVAADAGNINPNYAFDVEGKLLKIRAAHDRDDFRLDDPVLPEQYKKIIELSEIVSQGIDFVRADFYLVNGKIYFSELTNYPLGGNLKFYPKSFDSLISSYWKFFDVCESVN